MAPSLAHIGFSVNGLIAGLGGISVLEMFPIVISVSMWASDLANECILFHTDNQGLLEVVTARYTRSGRLSKKPNRLDL